MKLGLILEGGASRTLYSCGVQDALLEEQVIADYVLGVSAGISLGISYVSGQIGRSLEIAQKYMKDPRYMGARHLFDRNNRSYYNIPFAFGEVTEHLVPFDYEAFENFPGEVMVVVTNIHTGKAEYLKINREDHELKELVATCALPILFQPVKLGRHYYIDGGIADSIPYKKAMEDGCDKVLVILTRERGYEKKTDSSTKATAKLYRRYPKIAERILGRAEDYNKSIKDLNKLEQEGKVFVIAPKSTMGVGRTERDPILLEKLYRAGLEEGREQMSALKQYLANS
ncbi:MAG: patatin family protein [Lachnospiraceae bacterium]